jgi:hypothetical protein
MLGNFPSFSIGGGTAPTGQMTPSDGGDQLQSYLTPIAPYLVRCNTSRITSYEIF